LLLLSLTPRVCPSPTDMVLSHPLYLRSMMPSVRAYSILNQTISDKKVAANPSE
jgi:hypothetical protein